MEVRRETSMDEKGITTEDAEVVLAVSYSAGLLGAAYYEQRSRTLYILADKDEDSDFALLEALVNHVRPTTLLANRGHDLELLNKLGALCERPIDGEMLEETKYLTGTEDEEDPTTSAATIREELDNLLFEVPTFGETDITSEVVSTERLQMTGHSVGPSHGQSVRSTSFSRADPRSGLADVSGRIENSTSVSAWTPNCESSYADVDEDLKDVTVKLEDDTVVVNGVDSDAESEVDESLDCTLLLMHNNSYKWENGSRSIMELFRDPHVEKVDELEVVARLTIDLTMVNMVRAVGALLSYCEVMQIGATNRMLNSCPVAVERVKKFQVGCLVDIDRTTFRALEIFTSNRTLDMRTRVSPSLIQKDPSRICLFSLVNRCRSGAGRVMLRRWFERPTTHFAELRKRQSAVKLLLSDLHGFTSFLMSKLGKIKNLRAAMKRARMYTMKATDWQLIYTSASVFLAVGEFMRTKGVKVSLIEHLMPLFDESLEDFVRLLEVLVDFNSCKRDNRFVVNRGIDEELDFWKNALEGLDDYLTAKAKTEQRHFNSDRVSLQFTRAHGYMAVVDSNEISRNHPRISSIIMEDRGLLFVRTPFTEKLEHKLGDLNSRILDRETPLLHKLQKFLLDMNNQLLGLLRATSMLDSALALATTANQFGWVCPELVDEPVIVAKRAVHPISALLTRKAFVANDIRSGGDHTKVKVFTGPNAAGKSVYLKTVGLVTFLAHIGSFVPAECAEIGPVAHIMTRMFNEQCVVNKLSSFALDIQQVSNAVNRAGRRSLVLIDEFGKGTSMEVGISVLASTLNYWIRQGKEHCPHVYASTHFHALRSLLENDGDIVSLHAMDASLIRNDLIFHYKVVDGIASASYAAYVARKNGMPDQVCARAAEIYCKLREGTDLVSIATALDEDDENNRMIEKFEGVINSFLSCDFSDDDYRDEFLDNYARVSEEWAMEKENRPQTQDRGEQSQALSSGFVTPTGTQEEIKPPVRLEDHSTSHVWHESVAESSVISVQQDGQQIQLLNLTDASRSHQNGRDMSIMEVTVNKEEEEEECEGVLPVTPPRPPWNRGVIPMTPPLSLLQKDNSQEARDEPFDGHSNSMANETYIEFPGDFPSDLRMISQCVSNTQRVDEESEGIEGEDAVCEPAHTSGEPMTSEDGETAGQREGVDVEEIQVMNRDAEELLLALQEDQNLSPKPKLTCGEEPEVQTVPMAFDESVQSILKGRSGRESRDRSRLCVSFLEETIVSTSVKVPGSKVSDRSSSVSHVAGGWCSEDSVLSGRNSTKRSLYFNWGSLIQEKRSQQQSQKVLDVPSVERKSITQPVVEERKHKEQQEEVIKNCIIDDTIHGGDQDEEERGSSPVGEADCEKPMAPPRSSTPNTSGLDTTGALKLIFGETSKEDNLTTTVVEGEKKEETEDTGGTEKRQCTPDVPTVLVEGDRGSEVLNVDEQLDRNNDERPTDVEMQIVEEAVLSRILSDGDEVTALTGTSGEKQAMEKEAKRTLIVNNDPVEIGSGAEQCRTNVTKEVEGETNVKPSLVGPVSDESSLSPRPNSTLLSSQPARSTSFVTSDPGPSDLSSVDARLSSQSNSSRLTEISRIEWESGDDSEYVSLRSGLMEKPLTEQELDERCAQGLSLVDLFGDSDEEENETEQLQQSQTTSTAAISQHYYQPSSRDNPLMKSVAEKRPGGVFLSPRAPKERKLLNVTAPSESSSVTSEETARFIDEKIYSINTPRPPKEKRPRDALC